MQPEDDFIYVATDTGIIPVANNGTAYNLGYTDREQKILKEYFDKVDVFVLSTQHFPRRMGHVELNSIRNRLVLFSDQYGIHYERTITDKDIATEIKRIFPNKKVCLINRNFVLAISNYIQAETDLEQADQELKEYSIPQVIN